VSAAVRAPIDPSTGRSPPIAWNPRSIASGSDIDAGIGATSTGNRVRWPRSTSRSARSSDISWTAVTPRDAASPAACSWNPSIRCVSYERSTHAVARWFASFVRRPVGRRSGSSSTPSASARSIAASVDELTTEMWPSARVATTGEDVIASRSWAVGSSWASHRDSSNPSTWTTAASSAARARISARSSSFEVASRTSAFARDRPVVVRWTWLSMKPGTIVVPGRSIVSSASGGSPMPTRCTWRSSTRIHPPIGGWERVTTREAR
jgi:hypothetical protein